jgi:5-methylcytosine-specific restriction endonuclease McrA
MKPRRRTFSGEDPPGKSGWAKYARRFPERAAIYRSPRWQFEPTRQLEREPDCRVCGAPATHADHLIPLAEGGAPFDASNLGSLCKPCHLEKTQAEYQRKKRTRSERRNR